MENKQEDREQDDTKQVEPIKVSVVNIKMPFLSIVILMVKWALATIPAVFIIIFVIILFFKLFWDIIF